MNQKTKKWLQGISLVLSALFLFYGIYRGEVFTVLQKAVNICLECIGLGMCILG